MKNNIKIRGTIYANPELYEVTQEDEFYKIMVEVKRISGNTDIIPVIVARKSIDPSADYVGLRMDIVGKLASKRTKGHLDIYVLPETSSIYEQYDENEEDINDFEIDVKFQRCVVRTTPLTNKRIADTYVTYKRGKDSFYFPAIVWNNLVYKVEKLEKHSKIKLYGRFQSRIYNKVLDNEEVVEKTAFELSVYKIS